MRSRRCWPRILAVALLSGASSLHAQERSAETRASPAIPMSRAILRAHAAGTRDSSGRPGRNYWQLRTSYSIDARLDVVTSRVSASATIVLHNTSPVALDVVHLRLDQNRFRRGTGAEGASSHATDGMTITSLVVYGNSAAIGGDIASTRPVLSGSRRTNERLMLARAVASGDSLVMNIAWHFEVPLDDAGSALRLGRWGTDVYQVAQWYPRIAMFDDLAGWDTTSYTGDAEFYNPYASFDVRLDVPAGWLVGATGELRNARDVLAPEAYERFARVPATDSIATIVGASERRAGISTRDGARLTWHFVADTVSDFAWGASPSYVWRAGRVSIPGASPIPVHMFFRPSSAARFDAAWPVVRHDLAFNSTLIAPYPFPQHTLLEGPEGGMEYPMLTMSDGSRLSHELWHQWFPMAVGSNETWYSFMDEGFATFLAGVTSAARVGADRSAVSSAVTRSVAPLIWPDDRGPPHPVTALYGYGKPSAMFAALADSVGGQAVLEALREYAAAWWFRHPSPWDFMIMMNRTLDRDLDAFWHRWIFSPG